jgi:hypothetical protein
MRHVALVLGLSVISTLTGPPGAPLGAADGKPVVHLAQRAAGSHADCFCRAQGKMFAYGESACLITPEGPRIAQCQMALNVTSWAITARPCPQS